MEPPGGHCKASAVCDQEQSKRSFPFRHPTGSALSLSGVFPGPRGGESDVRLALPRWCAMGDQEPAPSGP